MVGTRVLVVSDSHLSPRTPQALSNWERVLAHVVADRPALVVHAGDISTDGANLAADLAYARHQLARSERPLYAIPGNHDIGENPHAGYTGYPDEPVDIDAPQPLVSPDRLARYRDNLGTDHWWVDLPGWRLVGLNAQLFGSELRDEQAQWSWLDAALDRTATGPRRVVLFVHKPLVPSPSRPADSSPGRYVPQPARDRLLDLIARAPVAAVVSGHAHQFCHHQLDEIDHIWAPSTWATIPDRYQPVIGDKVCGVVELTLHDDGTTQTELILPYGIVQQAIVDDVPDPYDHGSRQPR
jgi:3',5'-cyclic AMP phosphodiesterase CpdA